MGTRKTVAELIQSVDIHESSGSRTAAGIFLKALRTRSTVHDKLTQLKLSQIYGRPYYTAVSQMETGQGSLNDELFELAAAAFGVDQEEFGLAMLWFYIPGCYRALQGNKIPRLVEEVFENP